MAKRFKCGVCNKKFADRYNLVSHQNVHTTETPFACPQCPYKGKTKKYLARHTKQVHKERPGDHKCSVCGKFFLHQSSLKVHAMVHTGEKPHSCNVCGKTFRVTYSLNSHMLIHTNEKPFACSFCDYACRDSSTLRKHQNKHMGLEKIYECKICSKGYKSRAALKIHISETHLDVNVRKFPCSCCDKVFKSNAHRKMHIESIHERKLVCNCPICGRRLMNKNNLTQHMRTHLEERPFSCTHTGCKLAFKDKNSLTKHSVIHNPDQHFACSYCGRKFARKTHVQRHERVMHVERQRGVQCDYCGSKFYSKNYLTKHIQTKHVHRQKFKYICDICNLVTYNKPSIVMHLKYGHANDHDMQCKICDNKKVYKRHLYLKLHYWNTHSMRYKITRTNSKAIMKETEENPSVEIKVEPIEAESYEELQLMDIEKHEDAEECNDESLDYSKRVLSEDIAESVLLEREHTKEVDFDEFFIRHVFSKQEDKDVEDNKNDGVNEEQNQYVKQRIKQILDRTEKLEKAKALREKRRKEEIENKKREIEEAKMREKRERDELGELRRVREMYNERMMAAVAREKGQREQVKIKYYKNMGNSNKINKTIESSNKNAIDIISNDTEEKDINAVNQNESGINNETTGNLSKKNDDAVLEDVQNDNSTKEINESALNQDAIEENEVDINIKSTGPCDETDLSNEDIVIKDLSEINRNNEDTIEENSELTEENKININIKGKEHCEKTHLNNKVIETEDVNAINPNIQDAIEENTTFIEEIDMNIKSTENCEKTHLSNEDIENEDFSGNHQNNIDTIEGQSVTEENKVNTYNKSTEDCEKTDLNNKVIETEDINAIDQNNQENNEVKSICTEENKVDVNIKSSEHSGKTDLNNVDIETEHISEITRDTNTQNPIQINDLIENDEQISENIGQENSEYKLSCNKDEGTANENNSNQHNCDVSKEIHENHDNVIIQERDKRIKNTVNYDETQNSDDYNALDQPLLERRVKNKRKNKKSIADDNDEWHKIDEDIHDNGKPKKMEFKTFQCYICFKLYQTKQALIDHCQEHFDICHERTLTKCPMCNHVCYKGIADHLKRQHDIDVKIPNKVTDRKNTKKGSRYCYEMNGTVVEVIPSVNTLNKVASDEIDKKRRDTNNKTIAKAKLVKIGTEWVVEKEAINIKFDKIPNLSDRELHKLKITDNDVDRLGQLSYLVKKKGLKMMFPCFKCDKICQNFSALKLHKRKHEDNPKPFKPKVYKRNKKVEAIKKVKLDTANRTAFPKPILNKHKCDTKLKEFFESNIRGGDIEFWQFLKIFNKMNKEKVNDFTDLENRTDFGNHLDYYKDVMRAETENDVNGTENDGNKTENDGNKTENDANETENDANGTKNDVNEIENDAIATLNDVNATENDVSVTENDDNAIVNDCESEDDADITGTDEDDDYEMENDDETSSDEG